MPCHAIPCYDAVHAAHLALYAVSTSAASAFHRTAAGGPGQAGPQRWKTDVLGAGTRCRQRLKSAQVCRTLLNSAAEHLWAEDGSAISLLRLRARVNVRTRVEG